MAVIQHQHKFSSEEVLRHSDLGHRYVSMHEFLNYGNFPRARCNPPRGNVRVAPRMKGQPEVRRRSRRGAGGSRATERPLLERDAVIDRFKPENAQLRKALATLSARVAELENLHNRGPQSSSSSPSPEGSLKPPITPNRASREPLDHFLSVRTSLSAYRSNRCSTRDTVNGG